jgi:HD-GYP domain-containing protein (c-di-GMP phosphodiesterase class II)
MPGSQAEYKMIQPEIAAQEIIAEAPLDVVMSVIAAAEYRAMPGANIKARLIDDPQGRTLVEYTAADLTDQDPVIKELITDPPDHALYHHVAGPYLGTIEEIHLVPVPGATAIRLTGRYLRNSGAVRLIRHFLEEEAREHLDQLKYAAENRARRAGLTGASSAMVPIPLMTGKTEVRDAVIEQEEMEWGYAGHGTGVARIAVALAREMRLPTQHVKDLYRAAILHDLGKVALDSNLWGRRGTLSREQRSKLEAHPRLGAQLAGRAHLNDAVLITIMCHHERWDGSGYPHHLVGQEIPLKARILGLAEHVDTMMRAGNRRDFMPVDRIIAAVGQGAGREWEPLLAHRVMRMLQGR